MVFLKNDQLEIIYPNKSSLESKYAYALNNYRVGKLKSAMTFINSCIKLDNKNPYFHELKGQMFFENGNFTNAINSFIIATSLLPDEKGFKLFLAKSLFYHSGLKVNLKESINLLLSYIKKDEFPIDAWH